MKLRLRFTNIAILLTLSVLWGEVGAQQLFPDLYTPGFRGDSGTEDTEGDFFAEPFANPNFGDFAAAASDPTLTQVLTPTAFITSGFNIYSFQEATGYEIENDTSGTIGAVNNVVFQFDTLGTLIDYDTIELAHSGGTLAPTNIVSETRIITGGFGGFTNRVSLQWDLTGLGVEDYTISFQSPGPHNSFNIGILDASSNAFTEVVPSARTWTGGGGDALWSSAANWGGSETTVGGNVTFDGGAPSEITLDSDREIGLLTIEKSGAFEIAATGGSQLTINTGIDALPTPAGDHEISADVFLGGHSLIEVADGTMLELSGVVSGDGVVGSFPAVGGYKSGEGTLHLSNDNTFTGALTLAAGELILSGDNEYTGNTTILEGSLVIQGDAPNGSAGTLGRASSNVSLGVDSGTASGVELVIDGDHTVGRNISISTGSQEKAIVGRNTTATTAVVAGNVLLGSTADNVAFRAEDTDDHLEFQGEISGGGTSRTVTIDGSGTVTFSGSDKTYSNATVVSSGTLVLASGTGLTGDGEMTVASGALLEVDGTLGGSGAFTLEGGSTLSGNGTVDRAFTVGDGATISPGASPGTLSTVAQTWAAGGTYLWEINSAEGTEGGDPGWDFLDISGELSLTSTVGDPFTIAITSLTGGNLAGEVGDFDDLSDYSWRIASASGGITGFDPAILDLDTSGFANTFSGDFSLRQTGNDIFIDFAAIPEPGTFALFGLGLLSLLGRRRRR